MCASKLTIWFLTNVEIPKKAKPVPSNVAPALIMSKPIDKVNKKAKKYNIIADRISNVPFTI